MRVFYAEQHAQHDPAREYASGQLQAYPDCPQRLTAIRHRLEQSPHFEFVAADPLSAADPGSVHTSDYLRFLEQASASCRHDADLVATTFSRGAALEAGAVRLPTSPRRQIGHYSFDTTPITAGTYEAASAAAACALSGARCLLGGSASSYALCRPPGHHAGADYLGGYCYLNNAALAASELSAAGRVALIDIDYHHGNGSQDLFYDSGEVLFVSLHADPDGEYPLFWGYREERGCGDGTGCNVNVPLPDGTDDQTYLAELGRALAIVRAFGPQYLVVSAGVDTCASDPLGEFALSPCAFARIGDRIAALGLPTLLVQEGGYDLNAIGPCVANLLTPFA